MACNFNLRSTMLPGSGTGGTWTKLGFNATTYTGTFGAGGSDIPLGGDDPIIVPEDLEAGYYLLSYSDGCNAPQNVIYWSRDSVTAGTPSTLQYCINDNVTISLADGLTGEDAGGLWSVSPASDPVPSGAFNATLGTLNTALLLGDDGTYKFIYTVMALQNSVFEDISCSFCSDFQEVEVIIDPAFKAGNDVAISISLTEGSFNLFDKLTGSKDGAGIWTQLTGSSVPIGGDYLGTVNLNSYSGCTWSFQYAGGSGNCADSSIVTVTKVANWSANITAATNNLTVNHSACGFGSMTYAWFKNVGAGYFALGLTTQTIAANGTGTYKAVITCNGCSQETTYAHTQVCTNNPCFTFNYDAGADSLALVNNGTNTSPVGSDTLQWKKDGGAYTTYSSALTGCDLREFLDVVPFCQIFSGNIRVGYSSFTACPGRTISQVFVEYGDGTTETHSGSLSSDYVQWTPSQWIAKGNSATFRIRTSTPIGFIFKKIKFTYDGSGALSCSNITTTHINYPKLYYKIWGKRTVAYTDGCPTITCESFYQKDNGCILDVVCINCNVAGVGNAVCASVFNCTTTPTYAWKRNGSTLSGETNSYCPITYGTGVYECTVTCDGCVAADTIVIQAPCVMEVSVAFSTPNLVATVTNCPSTKTYQWQRFTVSGWVNVGTNSPTYAPTVAGLYKVIVTCVATGCIKEAEINYTPTCGNSVSISTAGNVLTAVPSGCVGAASYVWQKWNGTTWITVGTSISYTVTETGTYQVILTCDNCTATAQKYHILPCGTSVTIGVSGSGASQTLTANVTGCGAAPITYLWERWNGVAWITHAVTQVTVVTIPATYRITATCNGCPAQATYVFTGCSVSVSISVSGNLLTANPSGCVGAQAYVWELSTNGGVTWAPYATGQSTTANQTGLYRVTLTCSGCTATAQVSYTNPCSSNVSLSYSSPTLTATITGCPSPQIIIWQFSANYNPSTGGCSGWTQIASGVTSIVPTQTGCYRCVILCNGTCPNEAFLYLVISNPCDNVTMVVNPQIGKVSFDRLKKNGVVVTNYLISWRDNLNVEQFQSGAGSYYNPATMYAHPANNIPLPQGNYKPYILNADFGSSLDCLPVFTVPAIVCGTTFSLSYNGAGGIAASQKMSVAVNAGTGNIKIGFRTYSVADKVQVKYNGSTIFDSGNVATGTDWRIYLAAITYVSGVNYADVVVTNSNPAVTTKFDILINCCTPATPCPVNLTLPVITSSVGSSCECAFDIPATYPNFNPDMFNALCLGVDSYVAVYGASTGGCGGKEIGAGNYTCIDCSTIATSKPAGNGIIITFPLACNSRYLSVKARLQAISNNKQYAELVLKNVICASDGLQSPVYIFPTYGTLAFNDGTRTITYTMAASNPYANSCTNCDVWLHDIWNNANTDYSNGFSNIFGTWNALVYDRTMSSGTINVDVIDFTESIDTDCGVIERAYRISYRDADCPCQSWELYEDVDNNGSYETLRQQKAGWGGSC